jgi:hypothetical protein
MRLFMLFIKKTPFSSLLWFLVLRLTVNAAELQLHKDDHIALLGNGLAEGFQRDGWLETLLQVRFADYHLSFRNLGFAGDELSHRMRCENFGSPDDWLTRTKSTVVFAFFGYNESFGGSNGLDKFKQDLLNFVQETRRQKYNGTSVPQLVLFSPIAHGKPP